MIRKIVLVIATLCVFASVDGSAKGLGNGGGKVADLVASQPDGQTDIAETEPPDATEAERLAKFADKVSRRGDELLFRLKDGTVVSRKDSPPSMGYYDDQGLTNVSYKLLDFIDPWYVIQEQYYEGEGTQFINRDSGATEYVHGASEFSPDKARLLATGYPGGSDCNVEIWKLSPAGTVREWILENSCEYSFEWADASTVEIVGHRDGMARLKHDGTSWSCSGPSDICLMDEVISLLNSGADINAKNEEGTTALISAAERGRLEVVRLLLDKGADVNATSEGGVTALTAAVEREHPNVLRLLLDKGAEANARDNNGLTALMVAASRGYSEALQMLLDHGGDINATDNYGWTALIRAASGDHLEAVQLLINKGADINAKSNHGRTALTVADEWGRSNIVKLLREKGADETLGKPAAGSQRPPPFDLKPAAPPVEEDKSALPEGKPVDRHSGLPEAGATEGGPGLKLRPEITRAALAFAEQVENVKHATICYSKQFDWWTLLLYVRDGKEITHQAYEWKRGSKEWEPVRLGYELQKNESEDHVRKEAPGEECFTLTPRSGRLPH